LQLSWGRFHQAEEVDELAVGDGIADFATPQKSEHLIGGIEHRFNSRYALRMEAFRKRQGNPRGRFENLLNTQSLFPEVAPDRSIIQPYRSRLAGIEMSAHLDDGGKRIWSTLEWSRAQDLVDGAWVPRQWDQPWSVSSGAQWTFRGWQVGGQLDMHRGWPRTGLRYDATGALALIQRNSQRLPVFAQLDLRAQYTRNVTRGELTFSAELINAQLRANACCSELVIRDGILANRKMQWLPVVPSLGLRWAF
jgi:outer membrane cobalamin receptor